MPEQRPIPALTICQPYAHLIVTPEKLLPARRKRVENRTWAMRHRGWMWIHAGKSRDWLDIKQADDLEFEWDDESGVPINQMAFGAVVGLARVIDCCHIERISAGAYDKVHPWLREHNHTEGPWCIVLDTVQHLATPIPCRGAQSLWTPPPNVQASCLIQLPRSVLVTPMPLLTGGNHP